MVKTGKQKSKSFKQLSKLDKMIMKYNSNVSDTEKYLQRIKLNRNSLKSLRKDLKDKNTTSVSLSLFPLK